MKSVNRFKVVALIFCVSLVALTLASNVKAQTWNKKTVVTFSQKVEIPGVGQQYLPAGTYVFKLVDSLSDRDIVQIFNEDETHVFATILTIPDYRLKTTDETVMTFRERASDQPEAIRAWFYPGANWGQEFVYPKTRAIELAKVTQQPVPYISAELAPEIVAPVKSTDDPSVVALEKAPIRAITPKGEDVETAQVVEPPPVQAPIGATTPKGEDVEASQAVEPPPPVQIASATLPKTASTLPLFALIGLLSLGAGLALSVVSKRSA